MTGPGLSASRALLIDFGSTFTKVRAVDLESAQLLGAEQAPSTVGTTMMEGLESALAKLSERTGEDDFHGYLKLASSSAAGGLRIVAVGLIKNLTMEAARRAALGAGGKLVGGFANGLTSSDLAAIDALSPDILVLAGGTDGGNRDCIVGNAAALAEHGISCPVIVAGNRNAVDEVAEILGAASVRFEIVDNVLPDVNTLSIESCTEAIRSNFMERIVHSKGLDDAQSFVGQILMPTPHAVLLGCRLLSEGPEGERGLGELLCVDVGGATTDVYTVAEGSPRGDRTAIRGLPEPYVKRTVEGDLGMRINAGSIVEAAGERELRREVGDSVDVAGVTDRFAEQTDLLPETEEGQRLDIALGKAAVRVAVRRHAGTLEVAHGPNGPFSVQVGKDLRGIETVIATGGIFAANPAQAEEVVSVASYDEHAPEHLLPESFRTSVDRDYVLYAVGLLASVAPRVAYKLGTASLSALTAGAAR